MSETNNEIDQPKKSETPPVESETSESVVMKDAKGGTSATLRTVWDIGQLLVSVTLVVALLLWMLWHPTEESNEGNVRQESTVKSVRVEADGLIAVEANSPIGKRIQLLNVVAKQTTEPLMNVTGMVIASRRPGPEANKDFWQFSSEEILTTYSDWERAKTDAEFNRSVVEQVKQLGSATESGLNTAIQRMETLVRTGTETTKDLEALRTQLIQSKLQTNKDIYGAEAAEKIAMKNLATLGLKLSRYGLEPNFLESATSDMDVLAIEVPEGMLSRVKQGQSVRTRFFGLPNDLFTGTVRTVSPILSTEQRTLRVIVVLDDPEDRLRPGMYASVGLGIDPRPVIQIPSAAVLHIGQADYVLVRSIPIEIAKSGVDLTHFAPLRVVVGDATNGSVIIEAGLSENQEIIGDHAVLLKPLVVRSLLVKKSSASSVDNSDQGAGR